MGVGTVYRHFPTKEALVEALAADHFRHLAESARAALEESDPWEGFSGFMYRSAEVQAKDLALAEVMAAQPALVRQAAINRSDLHEAVGELVARAQRAGKLRKDVVPDDVPMLMCGIGRMTRVDSKGSASSWRRYVAIVLDGLRSPGSAPLPPAGPTSAPEAFSQPLLHLRPLVVDDAVVGGVAHTDSAWDAVLSHHALELRGDGGERSARALVA